MFQIPDVAYISAWMISAAAATAAAVTLWKSAVVPTYRFARDFAAVFESLDVIKKQLVPNGGSSLRDAIDRIENRISMTEQRAKLLCMDAPVAIFEADASGNFIHVNRTMTRWTGRNTEDFKGTGWINTIPHPDRFEVFEEWTKAVAQNREYNSRFILQSVTGGEYEVVCVAFPMYGPRGELAGWMGTLAKVHV